MAGESLKQEDKKIETEAPRKKFVHLLDEEQVEMKREKGETRRFEPVSRNGRNEDRDQDGAYDPMQEDMVPASVGVHPSQEREPVEVGGHSGPGHESAVPPLRQSVANHPGQHEVRWRMHDASLRWI